MQLRIYITNIGGKRKHLSDTVLKGYIYYHLNEVKYERNDVHWVEEVSTRASHSLRHTQFGWLHSQCHEVHWKQNLNHHGEIISLRDWAFLHGTATTKIFLSVPFRRMALNFGAAIIDFLPGPLLHRALYDWCLQEEIEKTYICSYIFIINKIPQSTHL